jgi:sec-independent protein translocase protein TatB
MFDFSFGELGLIVLVALLIVGPKDLPRVMFAIGRWFGQFKGMTDDLKNGFKSAMQEHQLHDVENDLTAIHNEIEYIRDSQGNMQRIYDISDFIDERDRSKIATTVAPANETEKKSS